MRAAPGDTEGSFERADHTGARQNALAVRWRWDRCWRDYT
jgi:hypothetical protein